MPDPDTPPDAAEVPPPEDSGPAPMIDDAMAEAMFSAAMAAPDEIAPGPTVISKIDPEQIAASARQSGRFTGGGANLWQPPSLEEAAQLFPNYEVLGLLGRGGMGAVYKARQIELDRFVAIKLLPLEISVDVEFADRFRREARAMAKLNHPNIIAVYDFGTTSAGHLFFVMEFVDGANLHQIIHGPGLDPAQTLSITMQVCEAFAFAHEQGVVHRDIKPANVMVDQRGRAKVADFGLARLTDPSAEQMGHTMTGTIMGTPDYMAPEQMRGMNVDHRADIYSLGVMLYEMLCKDVPRGFFDPPSQRAGVDVRIDEVVRRAMQQQPEKRYQQTGEMQADVNVIRTAMLAPSPSLVAAVASGSGGQRAAAAASHGIDSAAPSQQPRPSKRALWPALAAAVLVIGGLAFLFLPPTEPKAKPVAKFAATPEGQEKPAASAAKPNEPLEPGALQLWDTAEKVGADGGRWESDALRLDEVARVNYVSMSRDAIVRARIRMNPDSKGAQLCLRKDRQKPDTFYRLTLYPADSSVAISASADGKSTRLAGWRLARRYGPDEWPLVEFRVVGDELSVSIDGEVLGKVQDQSITTVGGLQVFANANGYFRDIVYVPLDKALAPVVAQDAVKATPSATAAPEPGEIKLWDTPEKVKRNPQVSLEDGLLFLKTSGSMVYKRSPSRDGILRASIRRNAAAGDANATEAYIGLRHTENEARTDWSLYSLQPLFEQGAVKLRRENGKVVTTLQTWPLPRTVAPGEWLSLEIRAVGEELTVSADGQVLGSFRDAALSKPGFAAIWARQGYFRDVVYVPLDGASSAASGAAPSAGAWQPLFTETEWRQDTYYGELKDGLKHLKSKQWTKPQASPDGAIRARLEFREHTRNPSVVARVSRIQGQPGQDHYKLQLSNPATFVDLTFTPAGGASESIARVPIPKPPQPGEKVELELRVEGDRLIGKLNGAVVIDARDSRAKGPGEWGINANDGWYESVEVQELPDARVPSAASATEKWRDWIAETRTQGSLERLRFADDGTLVRTLGPMGADWPHKLTARDGAIRATWKLSPDVPGGSKEHYIVLRQNGAREPGASKYLALVRPDGIHLRHFQIDAAGEIRERDIAPRWPLPAGFDRAQEHTLELRAVGDLLSVSLNGKVLGTARDSDFQEGCFAFYAAPDTAIRKMEYLSLDRPAGASASAIPGASTTATKDTPFINTLGMKFVPVPITGGPTDGQRVLFSVWETRVQDYEAFATETKQRWNTPKFAQLPTHPAIYLSGDDATAFCVWLTAREQKAGRLPAGYTYRLPHDHEWSCAAGIGSLEEASADFRTKAAKMPERYLWGTTWPPPATAGNLSGEEAAGVLLIGNQGIISGFRDSYRESAPVGSFPASDTGLYDLAGNAREWCLENVMRGGSFVLNGRPEFRITHRFPFPNSNSAGVSHGFRAVLAPVEESGTGVPPVKHVGSTAGTAVSLSAATKDAPFTNSLGMKFVPVPITGPEPVAGRVLFSVWETRKQDYEVFAKETKRSQSNPAFTQEASHPAIFVNWDDAVAFCAWLTERESSGGGKGALPPGWVYRLPSDHEWSCAMGLGDREDAAKTPSEKSGKSSGFPWGTSWPPAPGAGNYRGEEMRSEMEKYGEKEVLAGWQDPFVVTAPAGSFSANPLGLYDLSGNVTEWCQDALESDPGMRIVRGGSWLDGDRSSLLSSARRNRPGNNRDQSVGFRVVLGPAP